MNRLDSKSLVKHCVIAVNMSQIDNSLHQKLWQKNVWLFIFDASLIFAIFIIDSRYHIHC